MVSYSYLPFRLLCREHGADIVFTEMIAPLALVRGNSKAISFLTMTTPEERPIGLQLLATTPEEMRDVLDHVKSSGLYSRFDIIDLNFGCPSTKIQRLNAGAILLKRNQLAVFEKIIRIAVEYSPLPVTVKMRLGHDRITVFDALNRIADLHEDLEWITVHLRLSVEKRKGAPHFDLLPQIMETSKFRIVANGNFWTHERVTWAQDLGCAGVLIGRKARSRPDIFLELKNYLVGNATYKGQGKIKLYQRLLTLHYKYITEEKYLVYLKRLAIELLKGIPKGKALREDVQKINTIEELTDLFQSISQKKEKINHESIKLHH